jgi:MATE family multidrug resistance protein
LQPGKNWHRRVWLLAVPIILSNVTVPLVGAADTAVMGYLPGAENIAAVALGASIFSLVFWTFGFLRMGSSGLIAQHFGATDAASTQLTLLRYLLTAIAISGVVLLLQSPLLALCLWLLDAEPQLQAMTRDYYSIRIWSAPATFANYVLLGTFIGLQQTGRVLAFQLLLNLLNIALDLVFVLVFEFAIRGVALASVISEYCAMLFALFLIRRHLLAAIQNSRATELCNRQAMFQLFNINSNIFLRTLLLVGSFFYFHAVGARLGTVTLAANAILLQLLHICAHALDGFAHATETLVGQAIGARNRADFSSAIRAATLQALTVAAVFSLTIFFLGPQFIALFTNQAVIIDAATAMLPWLVAMPMLSIWSYQLDGIFIGATSTAAMRNGMLVSTIAFIAVTEMVSETLNNNGLWLAFSLFSLLRATTLLIKLPSIHRNIGAAPHAT